MPGRQSTETKKPARGTLHPTPVDSSGLSAPNVHTTRSPRPTASPSRPRGPEEHGPTIPARSRNSHAPSSEPYATCAPRHGSKKHRQTDDLTANHHKRRSPVPRVPARSNPCFRESFPSVVAFPSGPTVVENNRRTSLEILQADPYGRRANRAINPNRDKYYSLETDKMKGRRRLGDSLMTQRRHARGFQQRRFDRLSEALSRHLPFGCPLFGVLPSVASPPAISRPRSALVAGRSIRTAGAADRSAGGCRLRPTAPRFPPPLRWRRSPPARSVRGPTGSATG